MQRSLNVLLHLCVLWITVFFNRNRHWNPALNLIPSPPNPWTDRWNMNVKETSEGFLTHRVKEFILNISVKIANANTSLNLLSFLCYEGRVWLLKVRSPCCSRVCPTSAPRALGWSRLFSFYSPFTAICVITVHWMYT